MNELQVIVDQQVGEIHWNFEELKKTLQEGLEVYRNMVYDDDSIKDAKTDLANLRKLKCSVEDKRKEIKRKCMEPYEVIEAQTKELNALIDEPIRTISARVTVYEDQLKAQKQKLIEEYMEERFKGLPQEIAETAMELVFNPKWLNATCKDSVWKLAVMQADEKIRTELDVLGKVDEDFRETAQSVYAHTLSLTDAMTKVQELQRQKQMILEQERRRAEAERQREEFRKAMAEAERINAQARNVESGPVPKPQEISHAQPTRNIESEKPAQPAVPADPEDGVRIQLYDVSPNQLEKITGYIRMMGVKYEVYEAKRVI